MSLSRKELIIVALLLNVGVLAIIVSFATTAKKEPVHHEAVVTTTPSLIDEKPFSEPLKPHVTPQSSVEKKEEMVSFDEIDELLEEYIPLDEAPVEKINKEKPVQKEPPAKKVGTKAVASVAPPLKKGALPEAKVPTKEAAAKATAQKQKTSAVEKEKFYVVQSGDNPWKIAKKFHISFEKLLELNNLDEKRARNLKIGQRLKIQEDS